MVSKLQQVIRVLMILTRNNCNESKRGYAHGHGGLLILRYQFDTVAFRRLTYTVAAAGPWCFRMSKEHVQNEATVRLSSTVCFCDCPCEEDIEMFSKDFGSLHFICSFQDDHNSQEMEADTENFLQRLSLVNAKVTIILKVREKGHSQNQVFRVKNRLSVMDHAISMDSTTFTQSPLSVAHLPTCTRMHPVLGDRLALLLPSEVVEAGLCGEVSVSSVATLGPCMDQYPNWPTRLSNIRILVYGPSGVPLKRGEGQTQLSFFHSLAAELAWAELGLAGVRRADTQSVQGSLSCEVEFSVDHELSQETQPSSIHAANPAMEPECTVEQTVTLFLLIKYTDPFHSQLSDAIASEEILERCFDTVLWYNDEKVRSALQSLLKNTLRGFQKRKKSREKLQSAVPVILNSLKSIVSSSTSSGFRAACLNSMKVQSSYDLSFLLHKKLQRVINERFVSGRRCTTEKALEANTSEQNSSEGLEGGLPGKRAHREMEQTPSGSKTQCSEFITGVLDGFESSTWETLDSQMIPLPCSQGSQRIIKMGLAERSTPFLSTTELEKQQADQEWLQELDNLDEWD